MERTKISPSVIGVATHAYHKLGDISRKEPDFCCISFEDEHNYYGNWVEGFGFVDVQFPKHSTTIASESLTQKVLDMNLQIDTNFWKNLRENAKAEHSYLSDCDCNEGEIDNEF